MQALARWLLIAVLLVSLPLKGAAAAGALACGPRHAAPPVQDTQAHSHAVHAGDDHTHHHEGGAPDLSVEGVDHHGDVGVKGKFKCTSCAPCCAAALPTTDEGAVQGVLAPRVWVGVFRVGHDHTPIARLDRPPRPVLA